MASKVLASGILALGLGLSASVARAQRQPETFFKNRIGLSDSDIQKMDQGQVVTKVLESVSQSTASWFLVGFTSIPRSKSSPRLTAM